MDIPQERKVLTEIPGPRSKEWMARRDDAITSAFPAIHPIVSTRASGAIIEDVDGNRLIDFATGHRGPERRSRCARRDRSVRCGRSNGTSIRPASRGTSRRIELAERLNALTPGDFPKKTFFANSGAEAVENGVKVARYATGRAGDRLLRPRVPRTDADGHDAHRQGHAVQAGVRTVRAGDLPPADGLSLPVAERTRSAVPRRRSRTRSTRCTSTSASRTSPACWSSRSRVRAGSSSRRPGSSRGWPTSARSTASSFIADEIQSGMGRAGRWYAIEDEAGVIPDIVLTAKSLGAGFPISAVTGRAELMDAVHPGGLGGTYGGNPVAAAAALAVLDKIEREGLLERSRALGETIMARFRVVRRPVPARRRGPRTRGDVRDRAGDRPRDEGAARRGRDERDRPALPGERRHRADGRHVRQRGQAPAAAHDRRRAPGRRPRACSTRRSAPRPADRAWPATARDPGEPLRSVVTVRG